MTTDPRLPNELLRYLEARDRQRADDVQAALAAMTERERRLVREAAVMGYVQGARAFAIEKPRVPPDSEVLAVVIAACRSMSDLYPALSAITETEKTDDH